MNLADWLRNVAGQWWDSYWAEVGKAWDVFTSHLEEIWEFRWWQIAFPILFGGLIGKKLLETVEALQEFAEDMRLVPSRVAVEIADDLIPVPDEWKTRVLTADQALRFLVREATTFAVDIVDLDLPTEVDFAKAAEGSAILAETAKDVASESLEAADKMASVERSARFLGKTWIVAVIGTLLTTFAAAGCVAFAVWAVVRAHNDPEFMLKERALSQNSKRVYGPRRGQHRFNAKTGHD